MPTNHWFQIGKGIGSRNEQNLYQSITNELIQIAGADFVYIPRDVVKLDELFHEDTIARFTKNYLIEMYIENYQDFLGPGDLVNKFGFIQNDQLVLIVSRERFNDIIGLDYPLEGDLIFYPTGRDVFEIKYVDDKSPLFPLASRQFFKIYCEVFKYSNETMTTGTEADELSSEFDNDGDTPLDPFTKNTEIETLGDEFIDFSETNIFGENP